jgi:ankyrin repeat protein
MDIGDLLQDAANETASGKRYLEQKEADPDPPSGDKPNSFVRSGLRSAAQKVAEEDKQNVIDALGKIDDEVNQKIQEESTSRIAVNAPVDLNDVGGLLGQISEDIHSNKIRFNDDEVGALLDEAAAEMDKEDQYAEDLYESVSGEDSPDDGSDDGPEDEGDPEKSRELIAACSKGNADAVSKLLRNGASYNCRDRHGWTPLHWAASKGYDDIASVLIDASGERKKRYVNSADDITGWTPLHVCY